MSWGPCFMYYRCESCGAKFKYAVDMIPVFGESFGCCPKCGIQGTLVKEGAAAPDDSDYPEVED